MYERPRHTCRDRRDWATTGIAASGETGAPGPRPTNPDRRSSPRPAAVRSFPAQQRRPPPATPVPAHRRAAPYRRSGASRSRGRRANAGHPPAGTSPRPIPMTTCRYPRYIRTCATVAAQGQTQRQTGPVGCGGRSRRPRPPRCGRPRTHRAARRRRRRNASSAPMAVAAAGTGRRSNGNGRKHSTTSLINGSSSRSAQPPTSCRQNTDSTSARCCRIAAVTGGTAPGASSTSASQKTSTSAVLQFRQLVASPGLPGPAGRSGRPVTTVTDSCSGRRAILGNGVADDLCAAVGGTVVEKDHLVGAGRQHARAACRADSPPRHGPESVRPPWPDLRGRCRQPAPLPASETAADSAGGPTF